MSKDNENEPQKCMTKLQRQQERYMRAGIKDPKDQVLDFQRKYLANWMKKMNSSPPKEERGE